MSQSLGGHSGKGGGVASLMRQLLQEVRLAPVGVAARTRVAGIHGRAVSRLEQRLALDVVEELNGTTVPFCGLNRVETGLGIARGRPFNRVDWLLDTIERAQSGRSSKVAPVLR